LAAASHLPTAPDQDAAKASAPGHGHAHDHGHHAHGHHDHAHHHHSHDHGHHGLAHGATAAPVRIVQPAVEARPVVSALTFSVGGRLAVAVGLSVGLWALVAWAMA
jgi:hypothetical protein